MKHHTPSRNLSAHAKPAVRDYITVAGKEKVLKSLAGGFSLKAHEHGVTALFLEPAQTVSLLLSLSLV